MNLVLHLCELSTNYEVYLVLCFQIEIEAYFKLYVERELSKEMRNHIFGV